MADEHGDEVTADSEVEASEEKPAAPKGSQTLEKKTIKGQVITHTIVKPLPN
ncbi:hypothetical protein ABT143_06375 [Streptomyces sp. NPDC002033]|uniref:hypothetical protein n=1 Tax=unclassified Streptomyces TaxID=2593676 RepID=UPI00331EEFF3